MTCDLKISHTPINQASWHHLFQKPMNILVLFDLSNDSNEDDNWDALDNDDDSDWNNDDDDNWDSLDEDWDKPDNDDDWD